MKINSINSAQCLKNNTFKSKNSENKQEKTSSCSDKIALENRLQEAEMNSYMMRDNYMRTGNDRDYERYIASLVETENLKRTLFFDSH